MFPTWRNTFLVILLSGVGLTGCESGPLAKARLDKEVERLCAIDGGIKVYETVKVSPDHINEWGQINFYKPTQGENALGKEYSFKQQDTYYRRGNPEMWRTHLEVIRRADGKILGESNSYYRRGGDLPGPWHDSAYGCPDQSGEIPLFTAIFQR